MTDTEVSNSVPAGSRKLNQYGLTPAEWDTVVGIGCALHDALMQEPEGEDHFDGQSLSIMEHLVKAWEASRQSRTSEVQAKTYEDGIRDAAKVARELPSTYRNDVSDAILALLPPSPSTDNQKER